MRGIPERIQTRADLQHLFALAQDAGSDVNAAELAARIRELLAMQYHRVKILSSSGKTVTTNYFPEAQSGAVTEDGLKITGVSHTEEPSPETEGTQYAETSVTLSAAPKNTETLSVYMESNFLTRRGFDLDEIHYMLGVLEQ